MEIKILGTGCAKCNKLFQLTSKAVSSSGVDATVQKIGKIEEIMAYGVMMTPALVIDGQVKSVGRVPPARRIADWIAAAKGAE